MLLSAVLAFALAQASASAQPPVLDAKAACHLAHADRIPPDRVYSIAGTYFADGMHGSIFELPGCDLIILPVMGDAVSGRIAAYQNAFRDKCHGTLRGAWMKGVFTGVFERRRVQRFGMPGPMEMNLFVIAAVDTKDMDPAVVSCG